MHFHITTTRVGNNDYVQFWYCVCTKAVKKIILLHDVLGIWVEKGCWLKLLGLSWYNVKIEVCTYISIHPNILDLGRGKKIIPRSQRPKVPKHFLSQIWKKSKNSLEPSNFFILRVWQGTGAIQDDKYLKWPWFGRNIMTMTRKEWQYYGKNARN